MKKGLPIWLDKEISADEYAECRAVFFAAKKENIYMRIAADTDYTLRINGELCSFGQYQNYPQRRTYDELDISGYVKNGENEISVIAYFCGADFFTCINRNTPFICFEAEQDENILCASQSGTEIRRARGYVPGLCRAISPQLGFTCAYDFTDIGEISYEKAVVKDIGKYEWIKRPIKKLELKERREALFSQQGVFRFTSHEPFPNSYPSIDMQFSDMSFRRLCDMSVPFDRRRNIYGGRTLRADISGYDGIYWIADIGCEYSGALDFDIEVKNDCEMFVGYGEHLHDGRCRTAVRNFSASFKLKAGRNSFLNTFRRFGCRYLQFFVCTDEVKINYSGLRPTEYPLDVKKFKSGNLLRDTVYEVAQHTLRQCMHEHYEDCPWREQSLYALDSRNQMICGYYAFGETLFPRASLELLSYGQRSDGLLSICSPAGLDRPIPSFSPSFIQAMWEYIEHSGDTSLAIERFEVLCRIIEAFDAHRDGSGLVKNFIGDEENYWNFYEWAPTMDGEGKGISGLPEAPLNALYSTALVYMAKICSAVGKDGSGYEKAAKDINRAVYENFWNEERKLFNTSLDRNRECYSVLTNSLCLLCGAADFVPQSDRGQLMELLCRNGEGICDAIPNTISMNAYRFDALIKCDREKYAPMILDEIDRTYFYMLRKNATSFWETILGEEDFADAGSLCHGWSAMPIYYYETLTDDKK